jgi:fused signal recognition particle receptor
MRFWASPKHSMHDWLGLISGVWAVRNARTALDPGFPRDDPSVEPPKKPGRPIPTDVPMPEPMDVPAPDPVDVPVPDPGTVPTPAKPKPKNRDPKPRSVP